MRGKMRRPSGDWAIAMRMISWVGSWVMSVPSKTIVPVAGPRLAADRHHQRRLAGAVGADQGDDLALVDLEVDAAERDDLAVVGADAADGEERARLIRRDLLLDGRDLLVLDAEIGGDDARVVAHEARRRRRRSSRRSRARRCGRKSP